MNDSISNEWLKTDYTAQLPVVLLLYSIVHTIVPLATVQLCTQSTGGEGAKTGGGRASLSEWRSLTAIFGHQHPSPHGSS